MPRRAATRLKQAAQVCEAIGLLTQRQLAGVAGVSRRSWRRWRDHGDDDEQAAAIVDAMAATLKRLYQLRDDGQLGARARAGSDHLAGNSQMIPRPSPADLARIAEAPALLGVTELAECLGTSRTTWWRIRQGRGGATLARDYGRDRLHAIAAVVDTVADQWR